MIDYEILGRKVAATYPAIARELIQKPALYDLTKIPDIVGYIFNHPKLENKSKTEKRTYSVAVILKLYDPDILTDYKKKMRTGLRSTLNYSLNCAPTQVSDMTKKVQLYLKLYKVFRENVVYICKSIIKQYEPVA